MAFWNKGQEGNAQAAASEQGAAEGELRAAMLTGIMDKSQAAWKADRLAKSPEETTRFRKTKDTAWIKANEGTGLLRKNDSGEHEADLLGIDAAQELPREYKADTERSAMIALGAVINASREGRTLDDAFIDEVATVIHVRWLDVHGNDEYTTPEQKLPYAELSEAEKDRDRLFVRFAIEEYEARKK